MKPEITIALSVWEKFKKCFRGPEMAGQQTSKFAPGANVSLHAQNQSTHEGTY